MKVPSRRSRDAAENLAIQALAFIAEDAERLNGFLAITGIAPDQIRHAARESGFLAGVLTHMLGDESLLLAFAEAAAIHPSDVAKAARTLGGQWEHDVP